MTWMLRVVVVCLLAVCLAAGTKDEIGTFWQFTDFHVDTTFHVKDTLGLWGDYQHDASDLLAFNAIELGNDRGYAENAPDFVIWSGSSAPHDASTQDAVYNSLEFLTNHMQQAFSPNTIPLLPVIGGHDVFPLSTMSPAKINDDRVSWCSHLTDGFWYPWVYAAKQSLFSKQIPIADFELVCYHSRLLEGKNKVLLIGLNSLVWANSNPLLDATIDDPLDQFTWLNRSLQWVRKNDAKAVLISHHPLGYSSNLIDEKSHLLPKYNDALLRYIREYHKEIVGVFAGHEQLDSFRVVLDEKNCPVNTIFLAPSVSPLARKGLGEFNPRIRQYTYSRTEGAVKDYTQFALDLSKKNPDWVVEYTAQKEYQLTGDWHTSLANLLDEFTTQDDPKGHWSAYWKHELGGRPHEMSSLLVNGVCPKAASQCRCQYICRRRVLDSKSFKDCSKTCTASGQPTLRSIDHLCYNISEDTGKSAMIAGIVIGVLILILIAIAVAITIVYRRRRQNAE